MSRSLDAARSFLEQLEALGGRDGVVFAGEFSDIRAHSAAWKTESVCSTEAGSRPENLRKNRYKDVLPYDQTRVILSLLQEEGHGDYINGNFIRVILMACQEMENGRKKCERYWALQQEPLQIGPFCITLTREMWLNPDITLRILQVTFQKMIPPNFSLFSVVLEIRKQRPMAIQTEEQYRFLYHTVAQMFLSAIQNASPHYQNLKENCVPLYDDALSLWTSQTLNAIARPSSGVLRSISVPGPPALSMADTYAVVQRRAAPVGTGAGAGARARSTEDTPLYSQVTPRAWRQQARAEDARGAQPGRVPVDESVAGPGAYEDVADGAQTGGLGFNLRIGRPKGPRDPPAEWTRV
ncbi:hypothetical protein MJG53_003120 [Ovis ammon polii x Ovis aries]|uniref:Uncharacterized protein n=1 Tax=Ovis ammon polii x Ovis aries TaxID=2918886 RepID=A0ACB9VGB6_9CETA|nr:hypothetical protein MJT46_004469 [Ovis ammon polii x Ovis aries]KAI4588712.1 hypothetical protein MJG53_003120 [Ovis ammon polii x Ovis aries]